MIEDLDALKDELYPLARRAAMLYAITRGLQSIHNEYQFSLEYFIKLFDEAVGGELPDDFIQAVNLDEVSSSFASFNYNISHTCNWLRNQSLMLWYARYARISICLTTCVCLVSLTMIWMANKGKNVV